MKPSAIFFTDCKKCGELTGVEICRTCINVLFEEGIHLQGEHSEEELNKAQDHNVSLLCDECKKDVESVLCEDCFESN